MDFSGKAGGRVIQNLAEAQSAEKEEGQAWRVRTSRAVYCFPDICFMQRYSYITALLLCRYVKYQHNHLKNRSGKSSVFSFHADFTTF